MGFVSDWDALKDRSNVKFNNCVIYTDSHFPDFQEKKPHKNYYKPFANVTGLTQPVSIQESSTSSLELHSQTFWCNKKATFLFLTT